MLIPLNLQNIIYFIGRLAPIILVLFFVMVSIFNQDWRGVLYLSGILLSCFLAIIASNTTEALFRGPGEHSITTVAIDSPHGIAAVQSSQSNMCFLGEQPISKYPLSSVIIGFTTMYIFLPMIQMYNSTVNPLLVFLICIFATVDVAFLIHNKCVAFKFPKNLALSTLIPIVISYGLGSLCGFVFVAMLSSTNNSNLLYFGSSNTGPLCKLDGASKMSCKVYRNGDLLTTT